MMPITLYNNSTATFRAIIQLVHDIELNPGPSHSVDQLQEKANSRITIAHLHVRSLKSRDHFVLVKESILANKFDVFTISESWLDDSVSDLEIGVPDYNLYRLDRVTKKGGGVCVYVSRNYKTQVLSDISYITQSGFHQLWLNVQVGMLKTFAVCAVYRPPDTPLSCFDSDFATSLTYIMALDHTSTYSVTLTVIF